MANTKRKFRKSPPVTVSYDFNDILTGTGYLQLYAALALPLATKYEYYESGDDDETIIDSSSKQTAQTFTVGTTGTNEDFWVHGVELKCKSTAIDPNDYIIEIQETTSNEPNGTVIASGEWTNIEDFGDTVGPNWTKFTFTQYAKLESSTEYALVVRRTGGSNSLRIRFDSDESGGGYSGGAKWDSADSGATWTEDSNADLLFRIIGDTNPPLTWSTTDLGAISSTYDGGITDDYVQYFTQDIDVNLGRTSLIQGIAFVTVPALTISGASGDWNSTYYDIDLIKESGGSETSLGTAQSFVKNSGQTGVQTVQINISNAISFKVDDILRLRINVYAKNSAVDTGVEYTQSWASVMYLPFKVDI